MTSGRPELSPDEERKLILQYATNPDGYGVVLRDANIRQRQLEEILNKYGVSWRRYSSEQSWKAWLEAHPEVRERLTGAGPA